MEQNELVRIADTIVYVPSPTYPANTPPTRVGWYDVNDGLDIVRYWWNGEYWQETEGDFAASVSDRVVEWNGHLNAPPGHLEETIRALVDVHETADPVEAMERLLEAQGIPT